MAEPSGYGYYKEITVQDANIDGNLTNVPTLIQIAADSDIGGNIEDTTTGHDIRFYDITTDAILYYDRVYFNVAAGDCNATFYVKCPALYASPSSNQNKIRIYYKKAADSDGQDRANTWSDYVGVWHMADASGTVTDATGSHSSASQTITDYQAAGRVRYAMEFDGTNDGALIADAAALDQNIFTLQAWINADAWSGADYMMRRLDTNGGVGGTADGFAVAATGSGGTERLDFNIYEDGVVGDGQTTNGSGGIGAWYLCHGTVDSGGVVLAYMDGTVGANTHDFGGGITITGDVGMGLGCSEAGAGNNVFDGHMEEIRYRSSALSANQIKFEFNNMDSSVNADYELTWGAETAIGSTYTIECTTGTYAVTGATLNALKGSKVICTAGTYAITGADLNPLRGYRATCTTGAYVLTGAQLNPVYQENVTITPAVFNLILTFNAPSIGLGITSKGSEFHMFMDLSMN